MSNDEPQGCLHPTRPGEECAVCAEREDAKILAMSSAELRAECRKEGMDPDKVVAEMAATNDLIRAIIEDKASYDPKTNKWDTAAAVKAIDGALRRS